MDMKQVNIEWLSALRQLRESRREEIQRRSKQYRAESLGSTFT
jgi:hypothetical protein